MEVLHIAKAPVQPAPPPVTYLDVRLTYDEIMLVGGLCARTNGPLGRAIAPGGGGNADMIWNRLRTALGLGSDAFNAENQYLALVPGMKHVGPDGFAKLPESPEVEIKAANMTFTPEQAAARINADAELIAHLREHRNSLLDTVNAKASPRVVTVGNVSYSTTEAAERIKELLEANSKSSGIIREHHKVQGRMAETIAAQSRELKALREKLAEVEKRERTLAAKIEAARGRIQEADDNLR